MKKKIKLIFIHPYSGFGGADLSLSRLINGLSEKNYDIDFLTINNPFIKKLITRDLNYYKIRSSRLIYSYYEFKKFYKNIDFKKYKKVITISNQNYVNIYICFFRNILPNSKLILIERNSLSELNFGKNVFHFIKNQIIKFLIKFLYNQADKIITISKGIEKDLIKLNNYNIQTIYNGAYNNEKAYFKKRTKRKKIILAVGRLEKQKNFTMLLRAYNLLNDKNKYKLIIIGDGSEKPKLQDYINKNKLNNHVKIITNVKSYPRKYYKIADLFVLTSLYEGFGNVLVEAAIHQIPIISTNCASGPSEILNNGKYGTLIRNNDIHTLKNKIIEITNLQNKNKSKLLYNSLQRFSLKKHIKKYKKLFHEI